MGTDPYLAGGVHGTPTAGGKTFSGDGEPGDAPLLYFNAVRAGAGSGLGPVCADGCKGWGSAQAGNTGTKGAGGAAAIGIIGGADGPVTVFLAGGSSRKKTACSSLRFEPSEFHSWRLTFYEKKLPDITVKLF